MNETHGDQLGPVVRTRMLERIKQIVGEDEIMATLGKGSLSGPTVFVRPTAVGSVLRRLCQEFGQPQVQWTSANNTGAICRWPEHKLSYWLSHPAFPYTCVLPEEEFKVTKAV